MKPTIQNSETLVVPQNPSSSARPTSSAARKENGYPQRRHETNQRRAQDSAGVTSPLEHEEVERRRRPSPRC